MIWLVGSAGMLGGEVAAELARQGIPFVGTDAEVDIADGDRVEATVSRLRPRWIVNCAAYTAVDRAETEEDVAFAVNAVGPENLAVVSERHGASLVHVSTDYVFDGSGEVPHDEDADVAPLGAYGRSKAAGEARVREACQRHVIVRTSWLHGPGGPSFVSAMLRLMAERSELGVVDDQRGSPTYAADLAAALVRFVATEATTFGTFHYANDGSCSWYGFAQEIQNQAITSGLLATRIPLHPIPTSAYPTPAARPRNSVLSTEKIRATSTLAIPTWQDGLSRHLGRLQAERADT